MAGMLDTAGESACEVLQLALASGMEPPREGILRERKWKLTVV